MLEIKLETGTLDLPTDIQINLVIENPLLNFDKIPVPFTLPFEIPGTSNNLSKTNYPNRATSFKKVDLAATIVYDGIIFLKGLISVLGYNNKRIKLSFKGVDIFDALLQKMFTANLPEYNIGAVTYSQSTRPTRPGTPPGNILYTPILDRNTTGNIANTYWKLFTDAAKGVGNYPFYCAPVRVVGTNWQFYTQHIYRASPPPIVDVNIEANLPATSADEMYLNFYNVEDANFNLTRNYRYNRPGRTNPDTYVLSSIKANTRCLPFPYIYKLMDVFFSGTLINNPFSDDAELRKLCLITSYHTNWRSVAGGYVEDEKLQGMLFSKYFTAPSAENYFIKLAEYLPDIAMNDLLKELMKMFCMSVFPVFGKYKLVKNEDIMKDTSSENWQSKLIGEASTELVSSRQYKYGYEDIDDEDTETINDPFTLSTITEMVNFELTANDEYVGYFKISSTGEVYKKELVDSDVVFTRLNSGYGKAKETTGETFDAVSSLTPLPMGVNPYWYNTPSTMGMPSKSYWYCPEFSGLRTERPVTTHIMFDRGIVPTPSGSHSYPFLASGVVGPSGQVLGDKSLAWEGQKGLLNTFHKEYQTWIEKEKIKLSGTFRLSALDIKQLDLGKKKHVDGKKFYLEKLQVTLTKNQIKPAVVDFIEA